MVSAMTNMPRKAAIDGPSLEKNIKFCVTIYMLSGSKRTLYIFVSI